MIGISKNAVCSQSVYFYTRNLSVYSFLSFRRKKSTLANQISLLTRINFEENNALKRKKHIFGS